MSTFLKRVSTYYFADSTLTVLRLLFCDFQMRKQFEHQRKPISHRVYRAMLSLRSPVVTPREIQKRVRGLNCDVIKGKQQLPYQH